MSPLLQPTFDNRPELAASDLLPLSEASLALLDAASAIEPVDDRLLETTPARDLSDCISGLVSSLRALDVKAVVERKSWWRQFTGADLEARLKFDLACKTLRGACEEGRARAKAARDAGSLLWRTARRTEADQQRLAVVVREARAALNAPGAREAPPEIRARFERRIANLMTLEAANALVLKQIELSISTLRGLLDRFMEVERLLLPLWQRTSLAAAQAISPDTTTPHPFLDLPQLHASLVAGLDTLFDGKANA